MILSGYLVNKATFFKRKALFLKMIKNNFKFFYFFAVKFIKLFV